MLTELEGAILSEVHHRGRQTAFQVRRSFAESPSLEWRGSAGAVYGAIKRLEAAGLLQAQATGDARATRLLAVTAEGVEAMRAWACDVTRACSVGIDPFRIRVGVWSSLSPADRRDALAALRAELVENIAKLETFRRREDETERQSVLLALALQNARLKWLDDYERR